jgi:outer membrane protein assembly factor BamB
MKDHVSEKALATIPAQNRSWWLSIPWVFSAGSILSLAWIRWLGGLTDNGMINVLTYLALFAAWCFFVIGLMLNASRRTWITTALTPIFAAAVFVALFRIERVDAEIWPQIAWRWSPPAPLPDRKATGPTIDANLFVARDTDCLQFMGKYRNANFPNILLNSDWQSVAPKILWKQAIGSGWSGFSIQGDAAYTMEQREQEEWVSCYDVRNGDLIWKYVIPGKHFHPLGGSGPRATPTLHNGKVFALSAISQLVCLNMIDGTKVWSVELNEKCGATQAEFETEVAWGRSGSPLIVENNVIIPLGGAPGKTQHSLMALSVETGEEAWRGGSDQISYSSPMLAELDGTQQILTVSEKWLSSHSIDDGKTLWSLEWPGHSNGDANVSQPVVVDSNRVLISKGYGGGAQLVEVHKGNEGWSTKALWKSNSVLKTKFTSCVVRGDFIFGLSDGTLECAELATGKKVWKKGRYRHGQIMLVGTNLLITAENGELVVVAADGKEFRQLAVIPVIGDVTWNTPALSGNRLLMRNASEAACIELPLQGLQ